MKNIYRLTMVLAILFHAAGVSAQARSNISFGYGINKPFTNEYNSGNGFILQGNIAITNKISIAPAVGYESLTSARLHQDADYYSRVDNVDLIYIGGAGRYNITKDLFASLGPILYAATGNEDIINASIGGSLAAGYNLDLDDHNTLMFTIGTNVIDLKDNSTGTTSFVSFKVAYAFNFRGRE